MNYDALSDAQVLKLGDKALPNIVFSKDGKTFSIGGQSLIVAEDQGKYCSDSERLEILQKVREQKIKVGKELLAKENSLWIDVDGGVKVRDYIQYQQEQRGLEVTENSVHKYKYIDSKGQEQEGKYNHITFKDSNGKKYGAIKSEDIGDTVKDTNKVFALGMDMYEKIVGNPEYNFKNITINCQEGFSRSVSLMLIFSAYLSKSKEEMLQNMVNIMNERHIPNDLSYGFKVNEEGQIVSEKQIDAHNEKLFLAFKGDAPMRGPLVSIFYSNKLNKKTIDELWEEEKKVVEHIIETKEFPYGLINPNKYYEQFVTVKTNIYNEELHRKEYNASAKRSSSVDCMQGVTQKSFEEEQATFTPQKAREWYSNKNIYSDRVDYDKEEHKKLFESKKELEEARIREKNEEIEIENEARLSYYNNQIERLYNILEKQLELKKQLELEKEKNLSPEEFITKAFKEALALNGNNPSEAQKAVESYLSDVLEGGKQCDVENIQGVQKAKLVEFMKENPNPKEAGARCCKIFTF